MSYIGHVDDKTKQDPLYSIDSLHLCTDATKLISSHEDVFRYYAPYMDKRERCEDFVRGKHWTDEEIQTAGGSTLPHSSHGAVPVIVPYRASCS